MTLTADDRASLAAAAEYLDGGGFWDRRDTLATIRDHARARRVGPWAVLGGVLARVAASTPHTVTLPPAGAADDTGGSHARGSLNLFVGIVGPSSSGKGQSQAAADDVLALAATDYTVASVGSGEGLAHAYVHRVKGSSEPEHHATNVLFDVAEVDTLAGLTERRGATLSPELRKAWSGERLGFQYADPAKRLPVEPHAYRAALVVGIQPGRAGAILHDVDGGTPQRFLWLPATDPEAPDIPPRLPAPLAWQPPETAKDGHVMDLPVSARTALDRARVQGIRGDGDPLDGHAMFARVKVAAALALLERCPNVTEEDWSLAGDVMAVSDATRRGVQDELRRVARRGNLARGVAQGERQAVAEERAEAAAVQRTADSIMVRLDREGGSASYSALRRSLSGRQREYYGAALAMLSDREAVRVSASDYRGQSGKRVEVILP